MFYGAKPVKYCNDNRILNIFNSMLQTNKTLDTL